LRVPFTRVEPFPLALHELKARGFQVAALTPDPSAIALDDYRVDSGARLILLLGSEGPGLQPETMDYADVRLRIPIDARADSLIARRPRRCTSSLAASLTASMICSVSGTIRPRGPRRPSAWLKASGSLV